MTLTPEDRYHLDKWWLLKELKGEFLVSEPSEMTTVFYLRKHSSSDYFLVKPQRTKKLKVEHLQKAFFTPY